MRVVVKFIKIPFSFFVNDLLFDIKTNFRKLQTIKKNNYYTQYLKKTKN